MSLPSWHSVVCCRTPTGKYHRVRYIFFRWHRDKLSQSAQQTHPHTLLIYKICAYPMRAVFNCCFHICTPKPLCKTPCNTKTSTCPPCTTPMSPDVGILTHAFIQKQPFPAPVSLRCHGGSPIRHDSRFLCFPDFGVGLHFHVVSHARETPLVNRNMVPTTHTHRSEQRRLCFCTLRQK